MCRERWCWWSLRSASYFRISPWIQLDLKWKLFHYCSVFNSSKSTLGLKQKSVKVHANNITFFSFHISSQTTPYITVAVSECDMQGWAPEAFFEKWYEAGD